MNDKWPKESDSALQQRDVQALVEAVTDLDWIYLEAWAERLGVKDVLDQVTRR